jgi:hypothetical protein
VWEKELRHFEVFSFADQLLAALLTTPGFCFVSAGSRPNPTF